MAESTRIPRNVSLYEAIRTHPGAIARLSRAGVTRDYFDYRVGDAARALGLPLERLTFLLQEPVEAGLPGRA